MKALFLILFLTGCSTTCLQVPLEVDDSLLIPPASLQKVE